MAKLDCLNCFHSYLDCNANCPACGTTNFFQQALAHNDAVLLKEATKTVISQVKCDAQIRHKNQLKKLKKLQPPISFWQKVWYAFYTSGFVKTIRQHFWE